MNQQIKNSDILRFRKTVYHHFHRHGRELPWRRDYDPYHVVVSEIMLQQTQVDRVATKFDPFIQSLPGFAALAAAPLAQVLRLWQGLGYNRRALNLKRAAEIIMREYDGEPPSSPDILETFPGIGKATAASISAFAFNKPSVFLETNIRTVLIHHFFADKKSVHDKELLPLAGMLLDKKNPRQWYSALMDYGAELKKKYGNAGRRSAYYKKQSPFEGSRRQKRGRILQLLLASKGLTSDQISQRMRVPLPSLYGILRALSNDGIIIKAKNRYLVA